MQPNMKHHYDMKHICNKTNLMKQTDYLATTSSIVRASLELVGKKTVLDEFILQSVI